MKILIIGANGFLGRNLVRKCLELNWKVDCVYHNKKEFIPKQCSSVHIDDLEKLEDSYNAVFLVAAFIPEDKSVLDQKLLDVNIVVPLRVSAKFKKSKIIFSSSASVYGVHDSIISENSSFNNPDNYALSKLSAECILKFSSSYRIVRFSSIYGQGQTLKTFIPKLLEQAKVNKKLTLFGTGARLQNYIYIEDAVGYLIAAVSPKVSGIYLGVAGRSYSNTEVAGIIQNLVPGCKIQYRGEDNSPDFVYDNSYSQKILKFKPRFSLEEGIGEMLNG
ncbi:NAD(P)-dependent oxidoreductase [Candidatus Daviesbacteria bacterium]|nr:NAD(P)-dependent oxidoreductase [Candidatus Daviesbacteria bacterium]